MPLMEALARAFLQFGSTILRTILRPYFPDGLLEIQAYVNRCNGIERLPLPLPSEPNAPLIGSSFGSVNLPKTIREVPTTAVSTKKRRNGHLA